MGLFDVLVKIFSTPSSIPTDTLSIAEGIIPLEDAKCPYCEKQMDKPLTRKKTCPSCKQEMYVRTLPYLDEKDKIRVACTEEQTANIEKAWAKQNGTYDDLLKVKQRYNDTRDMLKKSWGKEPSESDVEWHVLIQERIDHAQDQKWGLYRNTTFSMADHLYKLNKYELALRMYLQVLYLDLNGPVNITMVNGIPDPTAKSFRHDDYNAFLAPGTVKKVNMLKNIKLQMSVEEIKDLFLDEAGQIHAPLDLPLSPLEAWDELNREVK